jgi:hypothetical protein
VLSKGGGGKHRIPVKDAATSGRRREVAALDNDLGQGRRRSPDRIPLWPHLGVSGAAPPGRRRGGAALDNEKLQGGGEAFRIWCGNLREEEEITARSQAFSGRRRKRL